MRNNPHSNVNGSSRITVKRSGHPVVDAIYDLEQQAKKDGERLFGNFLCIPDIWHHVIVGENGHPHQTAIKVFAEVWFRYGPIFEKPDEKGVVRLRKAFSGQTYQYNREELAVRWNVHPDQLSRAVTFLVYDLKILDRKIDDVVVNHRKLRRISYLVPNVDRLMELVRQAQEKVYKTSYSEKNQEKPTDCESGHPDQQSARPDPQSGHPDAQSGHPDDGRNGTRITSETTSPSASSVVQAAPPPERELCRRHTTTTKSSASPDGSAQNCVGGGPDGHSSQSWSASPTKIDGKGTLEQVAGIIRLNVGKAHQQYFGRLPEIKAETFEDLIVKHWSQFRLPSGQYVLLLLSSWMWADDAPLPEGQKTFDIGWYSRFLGGDRQSGIPADLKKLYETSTKGKLYIQHLQDEIEKRAVSSLGISLDWELPDVIEWWTDDLQRLRIVDDPDRYYREDGKMLENPWKTTWVGIYRTLQNIYRWNQSEKLPEPKWFQHVCIRWKKEGRPGIHRDYYDLVGDILCYYGHLSGQPKPQTIRWT